MEAMNDQRPPRRDDEETDETYVRDNFLAKVKRTLGRVRFVEDAVAAYHCALDPKTPAHVKAIIVAALAYFIMPVDAVPDFIAVLGYTDDATVFYLAWRKVAEYVSDEHRRRARAFLDAERDEK